MPSFLQPPQIKVESLGIYADDPDSPSVGPGGRGSSGGVGTAPKRRPLTPVNAEPGGTRGRMMRSKEKGAGGDERKGRDERAPAVSAKATIGKVRPKKKEAPAVEEWGADGASRAEGRGHLDLTGSKASNAGLLTKLEEERSKVLKLEGELQQLRMEHAVETARLHREARATAVGLVKEAVGRQMEESRTRERRVEERAEDRVEKVEEGRRAAEEEATRAREEADKLKRVVKDLEDKAHFAKVGRVRLLERMAAQADCIRVMKERLSMAGEDCDSEEEEVWHDAICA